MRFLALFSLILAGLGCSSSSATNGDAQASDSGAADARALDGGLPRDVGPLDSGETDAGLADATPVDSGAVDTGMVDTDAGTVDTGPLSLTEVIDDGTVLLPHTITGCAPKLAFAPDGTTYVAHSVEAAVRVARLDGRIWVPLRGALNPAGQNISINICPAMVVAPDGTPYVGFVSSSTSVRHVGVRRFVAGEWEDVFTLDRPITDFAPALDLSLTIDPSGAPVLALVEFVGDEHFVTARRLVGAAFVQEGPPLARASRNVKVTTRPDGSVAVLHTQQVGFGAIARVSILAAGQWTSLPDVASTDNSRPLLVDDIEAGAAATLVSYSLLAPPFTVFTATSTGGAFGSLGPEPAGLGSSTLSVGSRIVQTYQRDLFATDLRIRDGAAWGSPIALPISSRQALIERFGTSVHVAYTDGANAFVLRVNLPPN